MIAHLRVPITVPKMRVPATVAPPRLMTPMVPMISQEETIENIRQRDTVENNNPQQLKHRYPTRITQLSQDINQVDSTETSMTQYEYLKKMTNAIIDDDTLNC